VKIPEIPEIPENKHGIDLNPFFNKKYLKDGII